MASPTNGWWKSERPPDEPAVTLMAPVNFSKARSAYLCILGTQRGTHGRVCRRMAIDTTAQDVAVKRGCRSDHRRAPNPENRELETVRWSWRLKASTRLCRISPGSFSRWTLDKDVRPFFSAVKRHHGAPIHEDGFLIPSTAKPDNLLEGNGNSDTARDRLRNGCTARHGELYLCEFRGPGHGEIFMAPFS